MKIIRPLTIAATGEFTRASTGTFVDFAGKVRTASVNTPRFNFDEKNLAFGPVLLVEPAATNILLQSEAFDNAVWNKSNVNVVAGFSAPDTNNTANLIAVSTNDGRVYQSVGVSGAGTYTFSVWLRAANATTLGLSITTSTFSTLATTNITVDSTWKRYSVTASANNNTTVFTVIGGGNTFTSGEAVYAWGAQLELNQITSYIPTVATPVTRSAETNTTYLVSNVPENDAPVYNAATTYALNDKVLYNHRVYQSAQAANLGNTPPNATFWVDTGSSNRWKMFDQSITSQTQQEDNVIVAISPNSRLDSLVGLNINAYSITVNVVDPTYGNVYNRTLILTSTVGIDNWYSYFYEPIDTINDFILNDLSITYPSATITVCFNGSNVGVGGLISGLSKDIGITEWGAKVGIIDYSLKTRNAFGDYIVTLRNFSKRADFSVQVPTSNVSAVQNLLASYRGTPIVFLGNNAGAAQQFSATIIYGFYKDFSIDISYPSFCACSIQVEGLT